MRRGEGQFVAVEVGLRHDPKVLGMARTLKVSPTEATGFLVSVREFVLTHGTAAGLVRGYTFEELAAAVDWRGRAQKFIAALKAGGFLISKRGGFAYPHWLETATGEYAKTRADAREAESERKRRWREAQVSRDVPRDVPGTETGQNGDRTPDGGDQSIKDVPGTPPGPPEGGVNAALGRLDWFEDNYPKGLVKRDWIAAVLGRLTQSDWAHLQYALPRQVALYRWGTKRKAPDPERWIADLQWKRTKLPKPASNQTRPRKAEKRSDEPTPEEIARISQAFTRRAEIKQRLMAEGVPRAELEDRIEKELMKDHGVVPLETASMAS